MGGIILLSGGMDSAVAAYIAREVEGRDLHALWFFYSQRGMDYEGICAKRLADKLGVSSFQMAGLEFSNTLGCALLDRDMGLGEGKGDIPNTWVPQRNSTFLSIAFAYAETLGVDKIYTGLNNIDYSGYPDCRPEFVQVMEEALNLASKRFIEEGVRTRIECPLMYLSKADIVREGLRLGVPFELTRSCYTDSEISCGSCDSCLLRLKAFEECGVKDPIKYKEV